MSSSSNTNRPFTAPRVTFPNNFPKAAKTVQPADQCKQLLIKLCEQTLTPSDFFTQLTSVTINSREAAFSVLNSLLFYILNNKPYHPQFCRQFTTIFSNLIQEKSEPIRRSTLSLISLVINNPSIMKSLSQEYSSWNDDAKEIFLSFAFCFQQPEVLEWKSFINNAKLSLHSDTSPSLSGTAADFLEYINYFFGKIQDEPKIRNSMDFSKEQFRRSMSMKSENSQNNDNITQNDDDNITQNVKTSLSSPPKKTEYEMNQIESLQRSKGGKSGSANLRESKQRNMLNELESDPVYSESPFFDLLKVDQSVALPKISSSNSNSSLNSTGSNGKKTSRQSRSSILSDSNLDSSQMLSNKEQPKVIDSIDASKIMDHNNNRKHNSSKKSHVSSKNGKEELNSDEEENTLLFENVYLEPASIIETSKPGYSPPQKLEVQPDIVSNLTKLHQSTRSSSKNAASSKISGEKEGKESAQTMKSSSSSKSRVSVTKQSKTGKTKTENLSPQSSKLPIQNKVTSPPRQKEEADVIQKSVKNLKLESPPLSENLTNKSPEKPNKQTSSRISKKESSNKQNEAETMKESKKKNVEQSQKVTSDDSQTMKVSRNSTMKPMNAKAHTNSQSIQTADSVSFTSQTRPGTARRSKRALTSSTESTPSSMTDEDDLESVLMRTTPGEFLTYIPEEEEENDENDATNVVSARAVYSTHISNTTNSVNSSKPINSVNAVSTANSINTSKTANTSKAANYANTTKAVNTANDINDTDDDSDYSADLFGGLPEENVITFSGPPLPNIESTESPKKRIHTSKNLEQRKVVSHSLEPEVKPSSDCANVQTMNVKNPHKSIPSLPSDSLATTTAVSPSKQRKKETSNDLNVNDFITLMSNKKEWDQQLKAIEGLKNILGSKPMVLSPYCKEIWMNLLDIIISPRTMLSNASLCFTADLFAQFSPQLIPQTPPFVAICLDLCCNSKQFIADAAEKVLVLIAQKSPRSKVLYHFIAGANHKNSIAKGKAALCICHLMNQGDLEDNEFKEILSSLTPLIRNNRTETRDAAKDALNKIVFDDRFKDIAKSVCANSQDYNELMKLAEVKL